MRGCQRLNENDAEAYRSHLVGEIRDLLFDFVFEQLKVFGLEICNEPVAAVIHDGVVFSFSDLQAWDEFNFEVALGDLLMVPTRIAKQFHHSSP